MRFKEFVVLLEYRRDITAAKLGAQLIAAARKDHSLDASTDWSNTQQATDIILSKLEAMDPTRNQQYVTWLAKQYIRGQFRLEDWPAVHQTLVDYTKLKPRLNPDQRDINRLDYHTTVELVMGILNPTVGQNTDDQGTFPIIPDTDVLYNGPLGQLAVPQTEDASCDLGSGTKWCTAATETDNRYRYYTGHGTLTVWRDRNGERYQFFIPNPKSEINFEFMDSRNKPIARDQLDKFRTQHPVLRQWFQQAEQQIMNDANMSLRYAQHVLKGRWPDAEPVIATHPQSAVTYAQHVIQDRWPAAEPVIATHPRSAVTYARDVIQDRWPEAESAIIKDPWAALTYAKYSIWGRWPKAETEIIKEPESAVGYAREVIKGRWPEAEPEIMKDPNMAMIYARDVIKGRWPEAETEIMKKPRAAAHYAHEVLGGRWPKAEPTIMTDPETAVDYARWIFKGRWRQAESEIIKDPEAAALYAAVVIKGRWPRAEPVIRRNEHAYNYYITHTDDSDNLEDLDDSDDYLEDPLL